MSPLEIKHLLFVSDLGKTQSFYSAIGMSWDGGQEIPIGKSGLPERVEKCPDLESIPHLWGTLGQMEFYFFLDQNKSPKAPAIGTTLMVYFDEESDIQKILAEIKRLNLFSPGPEFDDQFYILLRDPDGRLVELCTPNAFRL